MEYEMDVFLGIGEDGDAQKLQGLALFETGFTDNTGDAFTYLESFYIYGEDEKGKEVKIDILPILSEDMKEAILDEYNEYMLSFSMPTL